ncbi:ESPR-type extended signal peptide-containing protein [Lysobacter capsici]|uniref:ESPR-type extended signal peptide-containing protein n=1 Tax=Lysobacter capsici TaxID=435897 RepID=UPI00287BA165|nr:ESPR-type extended signal peptide-containing protein [Lysobacter capsici]WND80453.1 ESPR-type extended signal peptide-containing protein [Lysobacter capsici]WND85650.1 ESPR-type extended signal peptide-containing protein [Lysobacter capsici]
MNIIYCRVWNKSLGAWVVASELAKGGQKQSRKLSPTSAPLLAKLALAIVGLLPLVTGAVELPSPDTCTTGTGTTTVGRDPFAAPTTDANDVTGGTFSLAAGCGATTGTTTANVGASAFGTHARALLNGSSAFGFGSRASALWSTALGLETQSTGVASTAIGFGTIAAGSNSVALGSAGGGGTTSSELPAADSTRSDGSGSVAIGANSTRGAQSRAANSIAIGGQATTTVTSIGGVAIGRDTGVDAIGGIAIGSDGTNTGARVSATNAIALGGQSAVAAGATSGIALGAQSLVAANATSGIAIGRGATVNGAFGIAQGDGVSTGAIGRNVAVGSASSANGGTAAGGAVAIGRGQNATGNGAVAIGDPNTASGTGAVAVGADNNATGQGALALGNANSASGQGAVALGNASATSGQGAVALGNASSAAAAGAVAMGDGASASIARSVALGSASTTAAAVGTTSTVIRGTTYNFAGTAPTSTVSVGTSGNERTVTNVAAGRLSAASTDAINGSQLFATNQAVQAAGAGFSLTAQSANGSNVDPSEAVDLKNTDGNIAVSKVAGDNNVNFDLADDITVNSVTAGATTLNTTGLTITGGPSVTGAGINAGNQVISNVAPGVAATDGVNKSQLDAVGATANAGFNVSAQGANASNVAPGQTVDLNNADGNIVVSKTGADDNVSFDLADDITVNSVTAGNSRLDNTGLVITGGPSVTAAGINAGNQVISNLAPGVAATDGVNKSQLDAVGATANAGFNVSAQGANASNVAPGQTVDLNNADGNIVVSKTGADDNVSFDLADDITVNSVTAGNSRLDNTGLVITGGPSVTAAGINAGNQVISNVAAGVAATDGVNKSQLDAVGATANAGFNVSAQGANASNVAPGQTVDLNNTDGNIVVSKTGADDNVSFDLADDIIVNSVTAGNSRLDNTGLVITGGPSVTAAGINAGNQVISNVAAGVAATDGVNKSQLDAVSGGSTTLGMNFTGNDNAAGDVHRDLGQMLSIRGDAATAGAYSGANLKTVTDPNTGAINVQLADSPKFGNVVINDGGSGKISGLTAADLSTASTDAVNGSQLFQTNQNVTALNTVVGPTDQSYQDANGRGVRYVRTNDTGIAQSDAFATGLHSTAVGYGARASDLFAIAMGSEAVSSGNSSIAIGNKAAASFQNTIAIGDDTIASGDASVAFGNDAVADKDFAAALGDRAKATGIGATALGSETQAAGEWATAIGESANAAGGYSTSLGMRSSVTAAFGTALGAQAQVSHAGSVALGARSVADGATLGTAAYVPPASTYAVAGTTPVGEVSIGATGSERRLINVAAGAGDTDAANISQLKAVDSKITALGQDSLLWDPTANGGAGAYNANHGGTGPNKIVNVAPADLSAASTDAVNGSQLFQTNQDVAALDTRVTTAEGDITNLDNRVTTNEGDITNIKNQMGPTDPAYLQQNGRGTRYARTNDTGLAEDDAHAQGVGSTAVGYNATSSAADAVAIGRGSQASHAGSVALGAGSVANGGSLGNAAYLVGGTATGEVNVGNRRVTGIAAGAEDTDAVNVSQLKAVATSATQAEQRSVKYDWNDLDADGEIDPGEVDFSKATLAGPISTDGGVTGGSKLTNLAQGEVSATSTDAVNGAQLYKVAGPSDAAYVAQNGRGLRYARTNDTGLAEADAHARGVGSTAMGYNATGSAENAVAVGRDSVASHANSIALGAGSSTTAGAQSGYNAAYVGNSNSTGQVQVGGRTIGGVAAGSAVDDAVNVAQLQAGVNDAVTQANSYTDTRVDQIAGSVAQYDNRISAVEGDVNNVKNGSAGLFQVSQDNNAAPTASGANAAAGGAGAVASGAGSTALGNGAIASANNAVALGAGSVANQEGTVSVGSAGNERRVSNVAAGTADTDAVNVSQLKGFTTGGLQYDKNADGSNNTNSLTLNPNGPGQTTVRNVAAGTAATDAVNVGQLKSGLSDAVVQANSYTDGQVATVRNDVWNLKGDIRRLERDMHSGIATAIAIKPAPYVAGRTTYYAGFGAYKSEAAFGVSLRHTADSGRWSLEGGASTNSDGVGAYVGISGVLGD